MTQNIAKNLTSGASQAIYVEAGQYMLALGGDFAGNTIQIKANIGAAVGVPITDASYTEPSAEVVTLPTCTIFAEVDGAGNSNVNVALAEIISKVDNV